MGPGGAAAISGVSQLLGSFVNWAATAQQNKKQRQFSREMAEYAWNKDVEMWDMQNKYNTPAAQMQRYEEAGLNPHLIYGQGTPGNASNMPNYQRVEGNFGLPELQMPDVLGMFMNVKRTNAEIDRIKAMTEVDEATKANIWAEILNKTASNWFNYGIKTDIGEEYGLNKSVGVAGLDAWHPPKIYYDLNTSQQQMIDWQKKNEINAEKIADYVRKGKLDLAKLGLINTQEGILKLKKEWEELKQQKFRDEGYNIDRDSISDRQLQELIKGLPAGSSLAKLGILILNALK